MPRIDRQRSLGALLGLGVGDALGAPVEGLTAAEIHARHGGALTEMVGEGEHALPAGSGTDDTEMTICLARALISQGGYSADAALAEYVAWLRAGATGVGSTVKGVLERVIEGQPVAEASRLQHEARGHSAGNGALMRTTPIAIAFAGNEESLRDVTLADAALTHYDPLAGKTALLHNQMVAWTITHGPGRVAEELRDASWLDERIEDVVVPAVAGSRASAAELAATAGANALATLAVGLAAYFGAESFEEGVTWAVNLGGDTDTNAAVTGALLGARFGAGAIPARWLEGLARRADLELLHDHLVALA